jgi:tetratricopeptide (TPR) repeat protein
MFWVCFVSQLKVETRKAAATQPAAPRKFNTFAHKLLDFEAERYKVPADRYVLLDRIIETARARINAGGIASPPTEKQLLHVLKTIDDVLIEERFVFSLDGRGGTLSEALTPVTLDNDKLQKALRNWENERRRNTLLKRPMDPVHICVCQQGSLLYMGVAEAIGLELQPVLVPHHVFVRGKVTGNRWINFDANSADSVSDKDYARGNEALDWQVKQGTYLSNLAYSRTMSLAYSARGLRCMSLHKFDAAAEDFRKSIELDPKNFCSMAGLASLYTESPLGLRNPELRKEALTLAASASVLEPRAPIVLSALASAHADAGDFDRAIEVQQRLLNSNGEMNREQETKRLEHFRRKLSVFDAIRAEHPVAFWAMSYSNLLPFAFAALGILLVLRSVNKLRSNAKNSPLRKQGVSSRYAFVPEQNPPLPRGATVSLSHHPEIYVEHPRETEARSDTSQVRVDRHPSR